MSKEFVPDGYMSEMFYSDEEPELIEKIITLRKLERDLRFLGQTIFIDDYIYNAAEVQKSLSLSKTKIEKENNEKEKCQQKQKQNKYKCFKFWK
jgi:hypothetical protein